MDSLSKKRAALLILGLKKLELHDFEYSVYESILMGYKTLC